jgi:hypothetical protein
MSPMPAACAVTAWSIGTLIIGREDLGLRWKAARALATRVAAGLLAYPVLAVLVALLCRGRTGVGWRLTLALTCAIGPLALAVAGAALLTVLCALLHTLIKPADETNDPPSVKDQS